ncbi:MAG TPA: VWA domain-containing protein [Blastocatellia bacterium]
MRFLSSSALWWMLTGAIIILFYLLKLKRKRRVVSSVILWQRALEEMEANAPLKRLRRSLLLLLQLVALVALVFSLARPLVTTSALASGSTIIIIDSSASMSARDEAGGTRLDRAKALAREMVAGLSSDDRAAVIESSSRVTVRSAITSDRAALASAISEIEATDAAGNLADAARLAEQLARSEQDASIVIISDGGASSLGAPGETRDPSSNARVRFVRVGSRADNLGIVAMNWRAARAAGGRRELFASVANFSDTDRAVGVELRIEGALADARSVSVPAGGRSALVFDALPASAGLAELRLDVSDDLASDNLAYAFLPDARRLRVAVASENPFLLEAVAANPDIEGRKVSADADLAGGGFDCVIADGATGAGLLASGLPALAIDPPSVEGLWQTFEPRATPQVTSVDGSHPVNSFLTYGDLNIESAPRRETAGWLRPIVTGGDGGLIWAGEGAGRRLVVLGFSLAQSDLPLKVEFPILLANSIAWLAGREADTDQRAVRAGEPVTIKSATGQISITTPEGNDRQVEIRDGSGIFADTLRAGTYRVAGGQGFAVSLLSESETDTAPKDSIRTRAGEVAGQTEEFTSEREVWRWIALIALIVLMFEWRVYHKRII